MNTIGTLLMGTSLLAVSRGYLAQVKGVNNWAVATLLQSMGWLIVGVLRGTLPDIVSIIIGNGFILLSLGLYFNVISKFNGKTSSNTWVYIVIALTLAILAYNTLIVPDIARRIAAVSLCGALLMYASSFILFFDKNRTTSNILTAVMFALCASILTARCVFSLTIDTNPEQQPFGPHPMQNISYLTFFITSVMLTFCFVLMCNDRYISQRKQAEEELIKAKKLAEQLAGAKDRFLSNMSHEIRTPLNGIIGFTKLLLQAALPPKERQQLEAIKTSGDILSVLINDILDLAKINEGKMTLEETEFNLKDLVNDILATFKLRMEAKELMVKTCFDKNIPNLVIGDSVRISQILINLINNSKKFTNNGGQITINVNLLEQNTEKAVVQFAISDTGIGITKEKLETIFEPFVQGDTFHKYEGTGLGLSIVKRLVDLMKGTITIQSELNKGTTVAFTIPLKKITTAAELSKHKETAVLPQIDMTQLGQIRVLLAEDNAINQLLAQTILQQSGFITDTAENGEIAIDLLNRNHYDIVLMDIKMPELDGYETTKYIRTQLQPPKSLVPIIAITADVTKADIDTYKNTGMNDYVLKPFNQTDLLNKIFYLVKESKSRLALINN